MAGQSGKPYCRALGIGYLPPIELQLSSRLANVLLGNIDVRGIRGRRGINLLLASALTERRIRLREIECSPAWRALEAAQRERRSVPATAETRLTRGLAVSIYGFNGLLPIGQVRGVRRDMPAEDVDVILRERLGQELHVHVLRLDPDSGHVFVSERSPAGWQLALPL